MFVGRSRELEKLKRLNDSGKFEFAVIYGRRRVGKTALLNEFVKGKDAIFFTGIESNEKQNLENFSECISGYEKGIMKGSSFTSFQTALEYVFGLAKTKRIILVIDEYPYAARASGSLASTLQMLIDRYKGSRLFLILCGSSMSYMEDKVLSYKAPLYGRRTAQIKLEPFDFFDARQCLNGFSDTDSAIVYGLTGGIPQYLFQFDAGLTMEENIKNTFLNPFSFIFGEPENLLRQEVREPALYNAIITSIASGCSRLNEIADRVGESTGVCAVYMKNLILLGIVKKESPYGQKPGKKTIYSIEDNMFRFWHRFVPGSISAISRGASDAVYARILPHLPVYMGGIFEKICIQYLWRLMLSGKCPVMFNDLGRWWGTDSRTHIQEEIDIMGNSGNEALFAECKWTNEKIGTGILKKLSIRADMFTYEKKYLYLFSKEGFTKDCREEASKSDRINLVSLEEMCRDIRSTAEHGCGQAVHPPRLSPC